MVVSTAARREWRAARGKGHNRSTRVHTVLEGIRAIKSVLLEHHFSRFDDDLHLVTLFKAELLDALPRDYTF